MARAGRPYKVVDERAEDVAFLLRHQDNQAAKEIVLSLGVDAHDSSLRTPLQWAAFYGNLEILAWLIQNGSNVNWQDKNGYTALHFAAQEKKLAAAALLLENKADPNITDRHGNTPLWTAIFNARGDWQLVQLYLRHGANPAIVNNYQATPADLAQSIAKIDLATLL